jgi:Holliday junction resolvase RusA-like endonuclease
MGGGDITLSFTIPGVPVPQARARAGKGGRHYTPEKSRRYMSHVAGCAFRAALLAGATWERRGRGPFGCTIDVYRSANRGDADNFAKAIKDGISQAGVWADDRYVTALITRLHLDRAHPRCEVEIRRLPC